jgi:hypothetical protein
MKESSSVIQDVGTQSVHCSDTSVSLRHSRNMDEEEVVRTCQKAAMRPPLCRNAEGMASLVAGTPTTPTPSNSKVPWLVTSTAWYSVQYSGNANGRVTDSLSMAPENAVGAAVLYPLRLLQRLDPTCENVPASHITQLTTELAPADDEYFPASHARHPPAPAFEYIPAAQSAHDIELLASAPLENVPAIHTVHAEALPSE